MSFYMSRVPRSFWKLKSDSKILSSFTNEEGSKEMEFREFVFDSTFKGLKSLIRKSTKLIEIDIDPNFFHAINKVQRSKVNSEEFQNKNSRNQFETSKNFSDFFALPKFNITNLSTFPQTPPKTNQVLETVPIKNQFEIEKKTEPRIKADMKQIAYEHELTPYEKEKIPFNFGKCALGTYLRNQIMKGFYDQFMQKTLKMSPSFVKSFKEFCKTVEYSNISHFRRVWMFTEFKNDLEYNKFVALTKITIEFLKKDVNRWINKKPKREDYKPIYRRCADFFLRWIADVDGLNCSDFC